MSVFKTDAFGRLGLFFDIPWFGSRDWKTMYDYPGYKLTKQHMPVTLPWALAEARKVIAHNNADPKPFVWTKKADEIIEKVHRCKAMLGTLH